MKRILLLTFSMGTELEDIIKVINEMPPGLKDNVDIHGWREEKEVVELLKKRYTVVLIDIRLYIPRETLKHFFNIVGRYDMDTEFVTFDRPYQIHWVSLTNEPISFFIGRILV